MSNYIIRALQFNLFFATLPSLRNVLVVTKFRHDSCKDL